MCCGTAHTGHPKVLVGSVKGQGAVHQAPLQTLPNPGEGQEFFWGRGGGWCCVQYIKQVFAVRWRELDASSQNTQRTHKHARRESVPRTVGAEGQYLRATVQGIRIRTRTRTLQRERERRGKEREGERLKNRWLRNQQEAAAAGENGETDDREKRQTPERVCSEGGRGGGRGGGAGGARAPEPTPVVCQPTMLHTPSRHHHHHHRCHGPLPQSTFANPYCCPQPAACRTAAAAAAAAKEGERRRRRHCAVNHAPAPRTNAAAKRRPPKRKGAHESKVAACSCPAMGAAE